MKAGEEFLLRYLEGHDKRFVIPVYQRNYDWKREQCQQLFDDILGIITRKQETYFIGSIVSIHNDDSTEREYVIIDGQQRITTLSLMLLAIHNCPTSAAGSTGRRNTLSLREKIDYRPISQIFRGGTRAAEKIALWDSWLRRGSLKAIGRAFGRPSSLFIASRSPVLRRPVEITPQ